MSNPDYNFEKVNRASVACGPLVKWAVAQVNEYEIYPTTTETKPLLDEYRSGQTRK